MVRAFRKEQTVKVGEEEFTLAIDISIIDALEDEFDLPFDKLMGQFTGNVRVGKLARLLRGLLSRHHPDLSLDDVGGLLMADNQVFFGAMERLFEKVGPDEEPKAKGGNPPKARRGTGASSSSRGAQRGSRQVSSGNRRREPCS